MGPENSPCPRKRKAPVKLTEAGTPTGSSQSICSLVYPKKISRAISTNTRAPYFVQKHQSCWLLKHLHVQRWLKLRSSAPEKPTYLSHRPAQPPVDPNGPDRPSFRRCPRTHCLRPPAQVMSSACRVHVRALLKIQRHKSGYLLSDGLSVYIG